LLGKLDSPSDMLRSTLIKYNLQVRIGMMDGIFVAYHNTSKLFGFEYIPREQMDDDIYGSNQFARYII
jgi:Mitochondrial protein Pet127